MGLGIGIVIGDCNWGFRLEIGIADWGLGLRIRIKIEIGARDW